MYYNINLSEVDCNGMVGGALIHHTCSPTDNSPPRMYALEIAETLLRMDHVLVHN